MRVVAGKYKNLVIPLPKYGDIRPTTDRAKEALFNILENSIDLTDAICLDLFSGSGSIALEMASRGALKVTTVEKNPRICRELRNVLQLKNIDEIEVINSDVYSYLKKTETKYDLIFADPPYKDPRLSDIVNAVLESELLHPNGLLVLEHFANANTGEYEPFDIRYYGQTAFSFYKPKA